MMRTFTMFAAVNETQNNLMCANWYAMTVRKGAGLLINEDHKAGWKELLSDGWRVRKVSIRVQP